MLNNCKSIFCYFRCEGLQGNPTPSFCRSFDYNIDREGDSVADNLNKGFHLLFDSEQYSFVMVTLIINICCPKSLGSYEYS